MASWVAEQSMPWDFTNKRNSISIIVILAARTRLRCIGQFVDSFPPAFGNEGPVIISFFYFLFCFFVFGGIVVLNHLDVVFNVCCKFIIFWCLSNLGCMRIAPWNIRGLTSQRKIKIK
jgi:hypothetical protein